MPTPLRPDGEIDAPGVRRLVDHLVEGGIDGLFPLGTSGEFALLTRRERRRMIELVVDATNGRVPVFAGISDPSTENMVDFSADARDCGADGVVATPPYYYSTTEDGLYRHFELLSEKVEIPLMVYNIPEYTHSYVPPRVIGALAKERMIVGMKYTENNLMNLLEFLVETQGLSSEFSIFTGSDTMAYSCLEFGGAGAVIGVANVAPGLSSGIYDAFVSGDLEEARSRQLKLLPVARAMAVGKFPAGLKEVMRLVGVPVGEPKEPIPPLSSDERRSIAALVAGAGLVEDQSAGVSR